MSENNTNDLNDEVEVTVEDAEVITVPIDTTLTRSGEAADAAAVGEALAGKADRSELQTQVNVNGQTADNQGLILVMAEHIPMSDGQDAKSVKQALEEVDGKTAADIPTGSGSAAPSVAEALQSLDGKTGADIPLGDGSEETVGEAIAAIANAVTELARVTGDEMSDADVDAVLAEAFPENEEAES